MSRRNCCSRRGVKMPVTIVAVVGQDSALSGCGGGPRLSSSSARRDRLGQGSVRVRVGDSRVVDRYWDDHRDVRLLDFFG